MLLIIIAQNIITINMPISIILFIVIIFLNNNLS